MSNIITTKTAVKPRKPRFMASHTAEWERQANALARDWVQVHPCRDCGGPVIDGYCCSRCGSTNPRGH